MFDGIFRIAALIALLAIGSAITSPDFGANSNNVLGNIADHFGWVIFIGVLWLLWQPVMWAIKLLAEGFLLGKGASWSGVFRDRYPRRRW